MGSKKCIFKWEHYIIKYNTIENFKWHYNIIEWDQHVYSSMYVHMLEIRSDRMRHDKANYLFICKYCNIVIMMEYYNMESSRLLILDY